MDLFDEHFLLEGLTALKVPLVKLDEHVDWKIFTPLLNEVFGKLQQIMNKERHSPAVKICLGGAHPTYFGEDICEPAILNTNICRFGKSIMDEDKNL